MWGRIQKEVVGLQDRTSSMWNFAGRVPGLWGLGLLGLGGLGDSRYSRSLGVRASRCLGL